MKKPLILIFFLFVLPIICFGQYTSKNNYSGLWTDSGSWISSIPPSVGISGNCVVYGEINSVVDLQYQSGTLTIRDTLVIEGDLSFGNNADMALESGAVLIVLGNLLVGNKVDIAAGGTIIIQGGVHFSGSSGKGSFTSEQEPAQVYIGGAITGNPPTSSVGDANPVIDCGATVEHENSTCNYGYIEDLEGENIEDYYQEIVCGNGVNPGSIGVDQVICGGGSANQIVEVTSSSETTYQWFSSVDSLDPDVPTWSEISGADQQSYSPGELIQTTFFYRQVQKGNGCIANSNVVTITVATSPSPLGIYHE